MQRVQPHQLGEGLVVWAGRDPLRRNMRTRPMHPTTSVGRTGSCSCFTAGQIAVRRLCHSYAFVLFFRVLLAQLGLRGCEAITRYYNLDSGEVFCEINKIKGNRGRVGCEGRHSHTVFAAARAPAVCPCSTAGPRCLSSGMVNTVIIASALIMIFHVCCHMTMARAMPAMIVAWCRGLVASTSGSSAMY